MISPPERFVKESILGLPYCDNLSVGAGAADRANQVRSTVQGHLESKGFRLHEVTEASRYAENLGFFIDGMS